MALLVRKSAWQCIVLSALLSFGAGCSSTHVVATTPDTISSKISIGDNLIVTTKDGQEHDFVVLDADEDYLVGEDVKVATKDIVEVKKRVYEEDATRFTAATMLVLILVFALSLPLVTMP